MFSKNILLLPLLFIATLANGQGSKKNITLEDLWKDYTFRVKSVPGFNALKDGRRYTQAEQDGTDIVLNTYDLATGKKLETIFRSSQQTFGTKAFGTKALQVEDVAFSTDETKLLLFTESQNIYRRSVLHHAYIYDLKTKEVQMLDTAKVLHAQFSPDGSKVAYVKDNNLYYRALDNAQPVQITTDGKRNEIINGNCDWVYEEEFEFTQAYQWSPDGAHIAYYRFDERAVPEYTMTIYDSLYPTPYKYKYPKAGEPNSRVEIHIYDVAGRSNKTVVLPGEPVDFYIPRIKWTADANQVCVLKMNRHQDEMDYYAVNAATGGAEKLFTEKEDQYIDVADNLQFLKATPAFIFSSERDGWNHLYRYDYKKQKLTDLTPGKYDVEGVTYVDESAGKLYYTAAKDGPLGRKLYVVDMNGRGDKLLTPEAGMHSITPCQGGHFFLDKFSTLTAPPVFYLRDEKGAIVRTLEDNSSLKEAMAKYDLGALRFIKVEGKEASLYAYMITPPGFDSAKKYPLLMYQYSGPNSQQVADKFPLDNYFFHQMLAEKGYIIVVADGTGTGFRGEAFRKKTYQQLGKYESDDQIAAAKYLGTLPYVDKSRIGIWGWSYGGFMASTCIFKGADVFKMAVAVAPVTNWRYYDNIYTERYMRTPAENPNGYDDNAPEKMAAKLKGKFLLVHGTGDDNVHVQNSMSLINNLIRANKAYDSEFYPNRAHGISGGNTRYHLFRRITDYILANL